MPTIINDWNSDKRRPVALWGVQCANCGRVEKSGMPDPPKGWEEAKVPNFNGRFPALCPDCQRN